MYSDILLACLGCVCLSVYFFFCLSVCLFVCLFGFFFGCSRLFCNSMKIKKSFEPQGTGGGCWRVMTTGIVVVDLYVSRFALIG
jgi:hypothetical protein